MTKHRHRHTTGPWEVLDGIVDGGCIGIGPKLPGIGCHALVTFTGGESEANAHLIATAPELLEALEELVAKVEWIVAICQGSRSGTQIFEDDVVSLHCLSKNARTIIARAMGEDNDAS